MKPTSELIKSLKKTPVQRAMTVLGTRGGMVKSAKKAKSSSENGKKGGRPPKYMGVFYTLNDGERINVISGLFDKKSELEAWINEGKKYATDAWTSEVINARAAKDRGYMRTRTLVDDEVVVKVEKWH